MAPRIVDVVFESRAPSRVPWAFGVAVAFLLHGAFVGWARFRQPSLEEWADELALKLHEELSRQDAIELPKPPPPPKPEPPAPPPPQTPHPVAQRAPAPPARAGQIVAQAPAPEAPVDFGDAFVVGEATSFAGGTTASSGTNETAVHTQEVVPKAPPTSAPGELDRSSPVSLELERWQCPWPPEADAAEIDEQSVLLRVEVDAAGSVRSAALVSDPGFGFGPAALACAERTHFEPAHDRAGRPIPGRSPPIRVRFTR